MVLQSWHCIQRVTVSVLKCAEFIISWPDFFLHCVRLNFSHAVTRWAACTRPQLDLITVMTSCLFTSHTVVRCPVMSDAPTGGGMNCSHPIAPHSFTSTCKFKCDEGFLLQGAGRIECDYTGQWTHMAPICKGIVTAPSLRLHSHILQLTISPFYLTRNTFTDYQT